MFLPATVPAYYRARAPPVEDIASKDQVAWGFHRGRLYNCIIPWYRYKVYLTYSVTT
jgi:hypothetical protein